MDEMNSTTNTLARACAASLRANGSLLACMLIELPKEKQDAVQRLLDGGGQIGIATLIDGKASNSIHLVAIEREGSFRTLATIATSRQEVAH